MPILEQGQIARFLEPHLAADPPRYARLRTGRTRRAAESVWKRDLSPSAIPAALAAEIAERHAATSAAVMSAASM